MVDSRSTTVQGVRDRYPILALAARQELLMPKRLSYPSLSVLYSTSLYSTLLCSA